MASEALNEMSGGSAELDMTPMIDIVFNLLIFFMLITDLNQKDIVDLTLPLAHMAVQDEDNDPDDRLILNVDKQGRILYKQRAISLDELGTIIDTAKRVYDAEMKLKGQEGMEEVAPGVKASKLYVLVRADKDTPWQHVQWLMTIMAEQKLYKLQFAAKSSIDHEWSGKSKEGADLDAEARSLGGKTKEQLAGKVR
jgi:biopolymer transport protein ExbD